jgi:hypothetical protein
MDLEPRKHAEFHVAEWLEERFDEGVRDNLIAVPAKLAISAVATVIVAVLCVVAVMYPTSRYLYRTADSDFIAMYYLIGILIPVAGFVVQAFRHGKSHPVIRLQSGRVRYEDLHGYQLAHKSDETGWLDWALFPAWIGYMAWDGLMAVRHFKRADPRECATILMLVHQSEHRIPAGEIEDMYPQLNVARALRALVNIEGVHVDRNRAHAIGLSNDLREDLHRVVYG